MTLRNHLLAIALMISGGILIALSIYSYVYHYEAFKQIVNAIWIIAIIILLLTAGLIFYYILYLLAQGINRLRCSREGHIIIKTTTGLECKKCGWECYDAETGDFEPCDFSDNSFHTCDTNKKIQYCTKCEHYINAVKRKKRGN